MGVDEGNLQVKGVEQKKDRILFHWVVVHISIS